MSSIKNPVPEVPVPPQDGNIAKADFKNSNLSVPQISETLENFKKGVNMGSNENMVNPKLETVTEHPSPQENMQNNQQISGNKAAPVPVPNEEVKNPEQNEGKNVPTQIFLKAAEPAQPGSTHQNEQPKVTQIDSSASDHQAKEIAKTSEISDAPRVMEENSAKIPQAPAEAQTHHIQPEQPPQAISENLNGKSEEISNTKKEARSLPKFVGSMESQQTSVKRPLRERRTRGVRSTDASLKCHICDKNGARVTLISCTQGKQNCDVYFWNIWIKKFNQSLTEEDYIKGIEWPVCQGICSCSKWRASVLEEDFLKVSELLAQNPIKDGGNGNQIPALNSEPEKAKTEAQIEVEIAPKQEEIVPEENKIQVPISQDAVMTDSSNKKVVQTSTRGRRAGVPRGPYKKHNTEGAPKKKSKRGRKKKNRNLHDGSSDSDIDLFNYDKFLKRASKKGTRVHMSERMYALRTPVEGFTALLQAAPIETPEKPPRKGSELSKSKKAAKPVEPTPAQMEPAEEIKNEIEQPEEELPPVESKSKNSNKDYLHAGEDFYNTEGYEAGRYNLRRRAKQQSYFDEADGEGDGENHQAAKHEEFKQAPLRNPGFATAGYGKLPN